jgi:hypothetical protein
MANEEKWDSTDYDKFLKESKNELVTLQKQLNDLMVKFILRALRIYQATRPEPLRPNEITLLVRNELNNAVGDLTEPQNMDNIKELAKQEWLKQHKQ